MTVLGISALYHDSAAALVKDGEIVAAAQEERFTRKKHDPSLPQNAIKYCLREGKVEVADLDAVVFYDNPFLTANRFAANLAYTGKNSEDLLEMSLEPILLERLKVAENLRKILGRIGKDDIL